MDEERKDRIRLGHRIETLGDAKERLERVWLELDRHPDLPSLARRVDEVHGVVSRRLEEERERAGDELGVAGRLVEEVEGVGSL